MSNDDIRSRMYIFRGCRGVSRSGTSASEADGTELSFIHVVCEVGIPVCVRFPRGQLDKMTLRKATASRVISHRKELATSHNPSPPSLQPFTWLGNEIWARLGPWNPSLPMAVGGQLLQNYKHLSFSTTRSQIVAFFRLQCERPHLLSSCSSFPIWIHCNLKQETRNILLDHVYFPLVLEGRFDTMSN